MALSQSHSWHLGVLTCTTERSPLPGPELSQGFCNPGALRVKLEAMNGVKGWKTLAEYKATEISLKLEMASGREPPFLEIF